MHGRWRERYGSYLSIIYLLNVISGVRGGHRERHRSKGGGGGGGGEGRVVGMHHYRYRTPLKRNLKNL